MATHMRRLQTVLASSFQAFMGIFFYVKSVAFIEDLPLDDEYSSESDLQSDIETGFEQVRGRAVQLSRQHSIV